MKVTESIVVDGVQVLCLESLEGDSMYIQVEGQPLRVSEGEYLYVSEKQVSYMDFDWLEPRISAFVEF